MSGPPCSGSHMPLEECQPAGFESHWDAQWFQRKADTCRRVAGLIADQQLRDTMLDLSNDLKRQSDHAALLAAVALGHRPKP